MKAGGRIKILHVVFSLDPGGMENGLVNVAKGLNPAEFEVHVCCLNNRGAFAERLPQPENVHVLGRKEGLDFKVMVSLAKLITRLEPDVIHSHNVGPLTYSSFASFFGLRAPILHGEHGMLPPEQCTPKRIWHRRFLYRACRKIHTVSSGQKGQLAEAGLPTNNVIAVINGVDTDRFAPADKNAVRRQLNLFPEDSQVLGIVGRFVALKRHLDLLEAFDGLAAKNSRLHLLIVGAGGAESERIQARVEASPFQSRIHLAGFQSNPSPYYQAMDVLVVPSILEGMSNVVLEAMACGIPVLAHEACGNAEMLSNDQGGVISDLSSVSNLKCEMEKMLADPGRILRMGQQARESVVTKFSLSKMVNSYATLYRQVSRRHETE